MSNISGDCWLAFLDLYGFSDETSRTSSEQIAEKLLFIHSKLLPIGASSAVVAFAFSDSIVLSVAANGDPNKALDILVKKVIDLQNTAIARQYTFRGSISYGPMTIGPNICVGKPLLRAVDMEKNLSFPIVVLPVSELESAIPNQNRLRMPIRTKNGILMFSPILPSPQEPLLRLAVSKRDHLLVSGPAHVALAWSDLIEFLGVYRKAFFGGAA